jgi:hypothetical protein
LYRGNISRLPISALPVLIQKQNAVYLLDSTLTYTALKKALGFFNSNFIARKTNVASVSNAGNFSQNPNNSFSLIQQLPRIAPIRTIKNQCKLGLFVAIMILTNLLLAPYLRHQFWGIL